MLPTQQGLRLPFPLGCDDAAPWRVCVCCCCAQVIGRVSGLTLLNGADVKPRERRDCELRYLQNVLAEQAEATAAAAAAGQKQQQESQQEAVAVQHPRVAQLMAQYGQVRCAKQRLPLRTAGCHSKCSQLHSCKLYPWVSR
jgi:hypothetical protein